MITLGKAILINIYQPTLAGIMRSLSKQSIFTDMINYDYITFNNTGNVRDLYLPNFDFIRWDKIV